MKKAKILLTAIGLFAIVGGALAFKANRGAAIWCSTTAAHDPALCTTLENFTITASPIGLLRYCTSQPIAPCSVLRRITNLQ